MSLHFEVHPSVAFQLGADLISDDAQALLELVKNCYDANARHARVEIDTTSVASQATTNSAYPDAKGFIKITDDGAGMDMDTVKGAWLVVSDSPKRKAKAAGNLPKNSRVPLGDKGLGRLGTQRLADNVELFTKTVSESQELHVAFAWPDFAKADVLSKVPIREMPRRASTRKQGTILLLSQLHDPDRWRGQEARRELEQRLSELMSPFEQIENFTLIVKIDGEELEPAEMSRRVRREADSTFRFHFDGESLSMECKAKLRYLEPAGDARSTAFETQVLRDQGKKLLTHLSLVDVDKRSFSLSEGSGPWFVRLTHKVSFDTIDKLATVPGTTNIASPGPFRGEVDSFDFDNLPEDSAFGSRKEFARHIKDLAGIRVFRDGFGVRVDRDFLQLARAWTGGSSWYGLKPANTIGFIAISAADNPQLVETTDREGFRATAHYKNFERLLQTFVRFSQDTLEFLRRGTIAYVDRFLQSTAGVPDARKPEDVSAGLQRTFDMAEQAKAKVSEVRHTAAAAGRAISIAAGQMERAQFASKQDAVAVRNALAEIRTTQATLQESIGDVQKIVEEVAKGQGQMGVLNRQIDGLRAQLRRSMEAIGLATTAEALAHEIAQVASGLAERVIEVKRHVGKATEAERVAAFLRHVETAVAALRKQLAHIEPSLRYAREKREVIVLSPFLQELAQFHRDRWRDGKLKVEVVGKLRSEFAIKINRGKLTQVFDNLFYNSEYWLNEEIRLGRMSEGLVTIALDPPRVGFSDSGRGIDPAVEGAVFEPFVSTKRNGRGLGLFIIRELLAGDGGTIRLLSDRNKHGRLHEFELDFSGIENG